MKVFLLVVSSSLLCQAANFVDICTDDSGDACCTVNGAATAEDSMHGPSLNNNEYWIMRVTYDQPPRQWLFSHWEPFQT